MLSPCNNGQRPPATLALSLLHYKMSGVLNSFAHAQKSYNQKGLPWLPALVTETDQGNLSPLSLAQMRRPKPTCFSLLIQSRRLAFALALASAGRSNPARMAMIAMTTNNSMSVNARGNCFVFIKKNNFKTASSRHPIARLNAGRCQTLIYYIFVMLNGTISLYSTD